MLRSLTAVAAALVLSVGCYHATIETGRAASSEVIAKPWANSWIYGLVPPATVSTAAQCPNGVARVETQLSFLNALVGALTFGIYTPINILVTCASAGTASAPDLLVPDRATPDEIVRVMTEAAERTVALHRGVVVQF